MGSIGKRIQSDSYHARNHESGTTEPAESHGSTTGAYPRQRRYERSHQKAEELRDQIPGAVILQQFENPANPRAHILTTAKEIWQDTDGKVDVFIAGVGTGGTLSGVGEGLKSYNPQIEIVAVEPDTSAVLSGDKPGMHKIQGIGAGFVPKTYNPDVVDKIVRVKDDDAIRTGRELSLQEGLLVGISSGAATYAALQLAQMPEYEGKTSSYYCPIPENVTCRPYFMPSKNILFKS